MRVMRAAGLTIYLLVLIAAFTVPPLMAGGLVVERFEGDVWHLLDATERMVRDQWPHLEFMTPLGFLALLPTALGSRLGTGPGDAVILGQAMIALALVPALLRIALSRLRGVEGWLYATAVVLLVVALTHPIAGGAVTTAMAYNRWAWGLTAALLPLALLPGRDGAVIDGVLIGLGLSGLVLIKATFFAGLLPGVAMALVLRRGWATALWAGLTGLVVFGGVSLWLGFGYWAAYADDLGTVARSEFRPSVGLSWQAAAILPLSLVGIGGTLVAAWLLWRHGARMLTLSLLFLLPGLVFITYRNFGAMALWVLPIAGVLAGSHATGTSRRIVRGLAVAMALSLLPVFVPFGQSILRASLPDLSVAEPMFPGADMLTLRERSGLTSITGDACRVTGSFTQWHKQLAELLRASGVEAAEAVFVTDVLSGVWLHGVSAPLDDGAPWSYGAAVGALNADYWLEPACVARPDLSEDLQDQLREATRDDTVDVVADTPVGTLYRIVR